MDSFPSVYGSLSKWPRFNLLDYGIMKGAGFLHKKQLEYSGINKKIDSYF